MVVSLPPWLPSRSWKARLSEPACELAGWRVCLEDMPDLRYIVRTGRDNAHVVWRPSESIDWQ